MQSFARRSRNLEITQSSRQKDSTEPRSLFGRPIRRVALTVAMGLGGLIPLVGGLTQLPATASVAHNEVRCPQIIHQAASVSWSKISWKVCFPGTITQSSPAVTTFKGQSLVAVGDESGMVHLLDASTGTDMPGWPKPMFTTGGGVAPIESSPAFAYLHGKSSPPDIVVAAGSTWVKSTAGEVQDFTFTGQRRWVFHVGHVPGTAYGVISTPAIGNVLGNGQQQIVFGSWDHKIYILDAHGRQVGFAYDNADTMWSSPALYRVPGRGPADIFIGSDASGRTDASLPGGRCVGGFLSDFHWSASAINPDTRQAGPGLTRIWYKCLNQSIWSSPAVGVINGTNRAAVVVGTSFFEQPFPSDTNKVFAFYAATGATVPGWPATTAGPALGSPAIGKIGSSNTPAVVETSWLCQGSSQPSCIASNHSEVEAFNGAGRPIWATRLLGPTIEGSAVLTPLRGEVGNDVLVGTSYGVYPIDGDNGRYMFGTNGNNQWATINPACRVFSTLAVAQTATGWEAIESCGGPPQFRFPGELAAFPLPTDPTTKPSWPAFRFNSLHQGSSRG